MVDPAELLQETTRLFAFLTRATREAGDELAMTATQRLALSAIADTGPVRLQELADQIGTTAPTASRAVEALVAARLVRRVEDPRDRRAVQIDVTREGRAHVDAKRAEVARVLAPAFRRLAEADQDELVELLVRLNDELAGADWKSAARTLTARGAASAPASHQTQ